MNAIASLAPWFSRLVLLIPTFIMIAIAARYIGNPTHAASPTGVTLSTPEALTDTRVVGALALTIAFAIAGSILSRQRLRMGHAIVIVLMAFILAVRLYGFAADGTTLAMGDQRVKIIGETLFLTLNTIGLFLHTYFGRQSAVSQ
jgi:hypothetical protein